MANNNSRRNFLRTAPIAAAVLSLPEHLLAQTSVPAPATFQLFTAQSLEATIQASHATPVDQKLIGEKGLPVTAVITTETAKSAKEFEWHEGRDHIVQILDGATLYEVGGTPAGSHSTVQGEWHAPTATNSTTYTMKKGDMLLIPRNTLHKRSTTGTVTFMLISSLGSLKQ